MAADRLGPLRRAKLRALARDALSVTGDGLVDGDLPGGATLRDPATGEGWVLIDDGAVSGFGAGLAWARRSGCSSLSVLVEDRRTSGSSGGASGSGGGTPGGSGGGTPDGSAASVVARRAAAFRVQAAVWRVDDRSLVPAVPATAGGGATGVGALGEAPPAAALEALSAQLAAHGVDPILEHGVLRGVVLGLEVARAVHDRDERVWRLDIGVGHHDREARHELRPGQAPADALDEVVAVVRKWRTPGATRHPANMLATERWLRALVVATPAAVGARSLVPVPPPLPPGDLRASAPAAAVGTSTAGDPLVIVCSTGVDVDLVPTAADVRLLNAPGAHLVLVLPRGDDYPLTRELAGALLEPAEVRTVPKQWVTSLF